MRSLGLLPFVMLLAGCDRGPSRQVIFAPVLDAAAAIEGSLDAGMSFDDYSRLLQEFSTQIRIAEGKSKSATSRKALAAFTSARDIYIDSARLWKQQSLLATCRSHVLKEAERLYVLDPRDSLMTVYRTRIDHKMVPVAAPPIEVQDAIGLTVRLEDLSDLRERYGLKVDADPKTGGEIDRILYSGVDWYNADAIQQLWHQASIKISDGESLVRSR